MSLKYEPASETAAHFCRVGQSCEGSCNHAGFVYRDVDLQGYLAHEKLPPPRTLGPYSRQRPGSNGVPRS